MNNNPLVSIIIPFYNSDKFLEESIESVLNQIYNYRELILIDDGSTDKSTEIAIRYAEDYRDKIFYFNHSNHINKGVTVSRNLGVSKSKGNYIAFLDSDDVWLPNKLEDQVNILETEPEASMVYGSSLYWFSWTGISDDLNKDYERKIGTAPNELKNPCTLLTQALNEQTPTAPPSDILVRKEIIDAVGGFEECFNGIYMPYEDLAFLAKIYTKYPVFVTDKCWTYYRQHPDSQVSKLSNSDHKYKAGLFYLDWLEKYLSAKGIDDKELIDALHKKRKKYINGKWKMDHPYLHKMSRKFEKFTKKLNQNSYVKPLRSLLISNSKKTENSPKVGSVKFGDLRRTSPINTHWGFNRGLPIDRYYIEKFLELNSSDIRGRVLEIGDNTYTYKYGKERVTKSDVFNHETNSDPSTTISGDITSAPQIPPDTFDCIIFTQTLQLIYDFRSAIETLHRILKPGGVLLATFPGISPVKTDRWHDSWYWGFTSVSAERIFAEIFPSEHLTVKSCGNVLSTVAFLHGLAAEELEYKELEHDDPIYEMLITVKAVK